MLLSYFILPKSTADVPPAEFKISVFITRKTQQSSTEHLQIKFEIMCYNFYILIFISSKNMHK